MLNFSSSLSLVGKLLASTASQLRAHLDQSPSPYLLRTNTQLYKLTLAQCSAFHSLKDSYLAFQANLEQSRGRSFVVQIPGLAEWVQDDFVPKGYSLITYIHLL